MQSVSRVPLHHIAWVAALLPFVTNHVSYLLAAGMGHVEWCMPYWDSCTSISGTGRMLPEKLWFKFGMIPSALCTIALFWCAYAWRRQAAGTKYPKSLAAMPLVGTFAGLFLILYTVALGENGDAYQLLRRAGVVTAFALTFIAQVLLARVIGELAELRGDPRLRGWHHRLMAVIIVLLATGVLSVILQAILGPSYDEMEHSFEWTLAALLNLYFVALALVWRRENAAVGVFNTA